MKKTSLYILIVCSVFSCKDVNDLNGSWIVVDTKFEYQEKADTYEVGAPPGNKILSFENGNFQLLYSGFGVIPEQFQGTMQVKNNRFLFDGSEDSSELKQKNSNIIEIHSTSNVGHNYIETYRRIADSLKHNAIDFSLVHKNYIRQYESYKDTVHFLNDSIYTSSSWANGSDNNFNYHRFQHNGFDILFTDKYPPFILKNKAKDTIYISTFSKEKEDYVMTEIRNDK
ncbi:MAG: hypothetical protein ACSHWW_02600 [Nonlabens sp.]|uniref:hypothetical protein n=1 Tax=Nonlabens sp. TaxID=1888209 RepID=UPI003EF62451